MKKRLDSDMIGNIVWGICFGIVAACMFNKMYDNITAGVMFILWVFNGYMKGRSDGQRKMLENIMDSLHIATISKEDLEKEDKKDE